MRDSVGDVAEQELLAAAHAEVADDDDVGVLLLRRIHDRPSGIVAGGDDGAAALAGQLAGVSGKLVLGTGRERAADGDPQQQELGAVALRHLRRPGLGVLGGLGPVGGDEHAPHCGVAPH